MLFAMMIMMNQSKIWGITSVQILFIKWMFLLRCYLSLFWNVLSKVEGTLIMVKCSETCKIKSTSYFRPIWYLQINNLWSEWKQSHFCESRWYTKIICIPSLGLASIYLWCYKSNGRESYNQMMFAFRSSLCYGYKG